MRSWNAGSRAAPAAGLSTLPSTRLVCQSLRHTIPPQLLHRLRYNYIKKHCFAPVITISLAPYALATSNVNRPKRIKPKKPMLSWHSWQWALIAFSEIVMSKVISERRTDRTSSANQKRLIWLDVSSIAGVHANTQRLNAGACREVNERERISAQHRSSRLLSKWFEKHFSK